jgi:hypothetical protein
LVAFSFGRMTFSKGCRCGLLVSTLLTK